VAGAPEWVAGIRRHVNLKQVDAEAHKPVFLGVAGARRDAFVETLSAAGVARPGAIVTAETLADLVVPAGGILRATVYNPELGSFNGALDKAATLPYAVCVLRAEQDPGANQPIATAAPESRPAPGHAAVYPVSSLELAQCRRYLLPDIVRLYHDHEIALAAAIPAFRPVVAAKLTHDCAMTCLKIAAASAVADHIPVVGLVIGGITSAGDTIALTALQMRMLLRIAAAYGKKPEFARILELLPVVGGGYGWRTLAREASGFIPIAGIPIKAAIAYAGTLVVGQVAAHYYETGLHMSRGAVGAVYREASERAKAFASRALAPRPRFKGRG
jgi:uncharacterized protein (DUF697 family)